MENLDRLTAAGLPVFDLNSENLQRTKWSQTSLGSREHWPLSLQVLVNTCVLPVPHASAIFWGNDLALVHNLAWGKASRHSDAHGAPAAKHYEGEALSSLRAAVRGRTVKVAWKYFFNPDEDIDPDSFILLSTILDEKGERQGALAQLLHHSTVDKHMPINGIDDLVNKKDVRQTKKSGKQQPNKKNDHKDQVDSKQTQLFQKFAELLPTGLAILDSNAETVFVNDGFFKLTTNTSSKEFRAWPESIHPEDYDKVMKAYREAFSSRKELRVEFRCATESAGEEGEWRLFLLRPLSDESEAGFICAIIDITEIKQAELAQKKAATEAKERKQQQERFIDMVSHEIRNPLSAVLHLAEEIKEIARGLEAKHADQHDTVADLVDAADTILLCVSHQNTLIDDILSFSKLDSAMLSLVPREVKPKWEFSSSLKLFSSEFKAKSIQFHYAMDVSYDNAAVDVVIADLNRMNQVLVNLITNAIKFTSKKKGDRRIDVAMGCSAKRPTSYPPSVVFFSEDKDAFHVDSTNTSAWGAGDTLYLMVAVRDNGIGISADDQAKLFQRFRQATPKTQETYGGTGLGLFISRKLCQLHGGDIGVSSKEGEGSTFGFFFKVRRCVSSNDKGRSSPTSRSDSAANQRGRTSRPWIERSKSYQNDARNSQSREDSNRKDSTRGDSTRGDSEKERPERLTNRRGVDVDDVEPSLKNPPTEYRNEAHPGTSQDERYDTTQEIAEKIKPESSSTTRALEGRRSELERGESHRQAEAATEFSKSQKEDSSHHPTILLVEDNLINQKVLRRQLQARGFEVIVASNGQEAVDAVEERGRLAEQDHQLPSHFDCILMDQEMPVKDGNQATMEIRELQEQGKAGRSPVLGVSANVREAQTEAMLEAGMDAVISKPYKVDDLASKIRGLLPNR